MKFIFKEEQKIPKGCLYIFLIPSLVIIYALYKQLIVGDEIGNNPMSNSSLLFFAIMVFALMFLFFLLELKTEINDNELNVYFFPIMKKTVSWKDVKTAKVINYGFVGGWGIRLWTKYGTVYNIKGDKGLAIELKSGKKFLIGTQRKEELSIVIKSITNNVNNTEN